MGKLTTGHRESSSEVWDYLEELVRMKVREFIQTLLEDEVTELLRRGKWSGVTRWIVRRSTGMAMGRGESSRWAVVLSPCAVPG